MKGNAGEGQETQEILKKHENNRKALKNHKIKNSNNNQKHKNPGIMSGNPGILDIMDLKDYFQL